MNSYEYKALDANGRRRRGLIEADGIKDARERLARMQLFAETILPTRRMLPFRKEHRAVLYRELGALLESGMPAFQALEMIMNGRAGSVVQRVAAAARDAVREGQGVAAGLSGASGDVSQFEATLLKAGERSGALGPLLGQLADYLERELEARRQIESAMIYPLVVFGAALVVAVVMLGALLPRTGALLGQMGEVPKLTRIMLAAGNVMLWGIPVFVPLLVIIVLLVRRRIKRDNDFAAAFHERILLIPVWRRVSRPLATERFAGTLAMLLQSDVDLVEAVELSGAVTGNRSVANNALEAASQIRNGSAAAQAIGAIPFVGADIASVVEVGQAGGMLSDMLNAYAARARREWENAVKQLLTLIEPLLILAVGLFVLLVALAVLLPVFSMSTGLGR